ncbi:hypothetical protein LCGC14_2357540 [marine sediment metagenome]|uniref:Uncharacterized protein n=1 Tax=marine sediment metagenome TaxID=412755 RepID=A0A0F9CUX0_9ZZZZ
MMDKLLYWIRLFWYAPRMFWAIDRYLTHGYIGQPPTDGERRLTGYLYDVWIKIKGSVA